MLQVQKYLQNGQDIEELFGIQIIHHSHMPLMILNYNHINSPKMHYIADECRGLVLEENTFNLIGRSFKRFYNLGEYQWGDQQFNWNKFTATEKLDGSLIVVYWYDNRWLVNTRRSFGQGLVGESGKTWTQLFKENIDITKLIKGLSYVFEMISPWNTVVRQYSKTEFRLLTIFNNATNIEFSEDMCNGLANLARINRPDSFKFTSLDEVKEFIKNKEKEDLTYEGLVLRDGNRRIKVKSRSYLEYHALKNNGNLFQYKNLVPLLLKGELAELLSVFTDHADIIHECNQTLTKSLAELKIFHSRVQSISTQKDFALAVKSHPLSSLLFKARLTGKSLDELWIDSEDLLVKKLFKGES